MIPARKIPMNYRNITGKVQSTKSNHYTEFESGLEQGALFLCEYDPNIKYFRTQPKRFYYYLNGKKHHYTPDIYIEYTDSSKLYVEIKYREDIFRNWKQLKPKFKAVIHDLKSEPKTRFKIWTEKEIKSTYLDNVKFILPYRHREYEEYQATMIIDFLKRERDISIRALLAICSSNKVIQAEFLNTLWHLISSHRVNLDMHQPLNMSSLVWIDNGGQETSQNDGY